MRSPSNFPAPDPGRLVVVSVNYRAADYLIRCLSSLESERELLPGLEVLAVDNASGDGSVEALEAAIVERGWGSWVRVLSSPENGGFAAGNNLALEGLLAEAEPPEWICLLNPDTEIYPGALASLVAFLQSRPRAGFAGPSTEVGRGNLRGSAFRFPGILNSFDEGLHLGPVSRLLSRWKLAPDPRPEPHATDWLSGGCLLVRRRTLEEVGLFDPEYFLYYEEVDLMLRARRAGWESWYVPEARIVHFAGASTGLTGEKELETRVPAYWFASRRRYFRKNRGRLVLLAADLAWLLGNSLFQLRRFLSRSPRREPPHFYSDFVAYNLLGRR